MAIPIGGQGGHVPTSGFVVETMPQRIVFGAGAIATAPSEVSRAELKRVLVIASGSSASIAARISGDLGSVVAGHLDEARQHVPRQLAEAARREAITTEADGLIAVGGGSSIGLAKAVAVRLGLPIIAVPVTYSGSEVSAVYGITDEHKRTSKDPRALPRVVIYDPELGSALSSRVTAATGFNALAHAVEALYAPGRNPTSSLQAVEAIRLLASALPVLADRSDDIEARSEALLGAYLAGSASATAGTALQHKLAHVLGGTHDLTHAEVHAVLLPHVTAYNQSAVRGPVGRCDGRAWCSRYGYRSVASRAGDRQPDELGRTGSRQGGAGRGCGANSDRSWGGQPPPCGPTSRAGAARGRLCRPVPEDQGGERTWVSGNSWTRRAATT